MRVISEQSVNTRLKIAPKDWNDLTDDEAEEFIIQLRGERGKAPARRAAKAKTESKPAGQKAAQPQAIDDWGEME